ncbi:type 1 periplasmic binding fold superfamily protein [Psychroflexus aestuariivivens]|uniref:type 1 periplasmic binding fold superfamily protein n=1 Tax=Psychroflexus aestuariivivens TaxID=1795040 RepID=UPI000FDCA926|nr:type 1 periplasmic binding fold superfamily protein [Psychroflexus aestuariivivens]
MKTIKLFSLSLIAAITLNSCSDDDSSPEPIIEQEVITTINIELEDVDNPTNTATFLWSDSDGDGLEDLVNVDNLTANTTYSGAITFLNELENPAEDITQEILAEDEEHQIFYIPNTTLDLTTSYDDVDNVGNPVGLDFTLTTGDASNGVLTVFLIHEGNKFAEGASEGVLTDGVGGETDIEVNFDVNIED